MELLIHESFETLQAQVAALESGTNPVVYFPRGTKKFPPLPDNAMRTEVTQDKPGAGTYYYLAKYTDEKEIRTAVLNSTFGWLLGFVQTKDEASKGTPALVVARDFDCTEVKTAAIDITNSLAVKAQKEIFKQRFPSCIITIESINDLLLERYSRTEQ